ncbi:unnamed protein product [Merluccius merluccius]
MLARALLHTSLVLWMTGLTLQGGYSTLRALGAGGYGAKLGKVAGMGLGTGAGLALGAGHGNGMGLGLHNAAKHGGYGPVAGVGYAGVRPGLEPVGKLPHGVTGPLAESLGQAVSQAQAGTNFGLQQRATLVSNVEGGAGRHQLPFSIERNQGLVLPVPPQAQGSSGYGSSPLHHRGSLNPDRTSGGNTGLVAAVAAVVGKQSKLPGSQVLVNHDGERPATPLGQEDRNYGLSFANSHSSRGYYGVAFEQGQRNANYEAAVTDKEAFKAQLAARERASLLGLLTSGAPAAVEPVSKEPGSRQLSVDSAAGGRDQGLVAGGGQVASSFSHVDPMLTTGLTRLAPPGLKEKKKQGPYMGYGAGNYPGAAVGVAGYGAGLGHGGYPLAAGAGKLGEFGDGTGAYGATGLGAGNGYGYGNGYNMGGNGHGAGGAGSVPIGAGGVYGDAQAMGLGSDSGLGKSTPHT